MARQTIRIKASGVPAAFRKANAPRLASLGNGKVKNNARRKA